MREDTHVTRLIAASGHTIPSFTSTSVSSEWSIATAVEPSGARLPVVARVSKIPNL